MADNSHIKKQVERLLPNWRSWYPSLFHAAEDLGVIRAQVCSPDSLMLSSRHSAVHSQALEAHRDQWGGQESLNGDLPGTEKRNGKRGRKR
jgi:hypothetical protein